jgi:hypothetical protein
MLPEFRQVPRPANLASSWRLAPGDGTRAAWHIAHKIALQDRAI